MSEVSNLVARLGHANAELRRQMGALQSARDNLVDEVCELRRLVSRAKQQRDEAEGWAVFWAKEAATSRALIEEKVPLRWVFCGGAN